MEEQQAHKKMINEELKHIVKVCVKDCSPKTLRELGTLVIS